MKNSFAPEKITLRLDEINHADFLASKPVDFVTGDFLEAGDKVAVCKVCKAVILEDSLTYLNWQHCNQSVFTNELPSVQKFSIIKNWAIKGKASRKAVFYAWFIDWAIYFNVLLLVTTVLSMFFSIAFFFDNDFAKFLLNFSVLNPFYYGLSALLYGTKDAWLNGQSLGKKSLKIKVIDNKTKKKCSIKKALLRTFLSPLHVFTPVLTLFGKDNLIDTLSQTSVVEDKN